MLPMGSTADNYESRAINYNARIPVPQTKAAPSKFSPVTSKVRKSSRPCGHETHHQCEPTSTSLHMRCL
jgi:hypothetical protein